MNAGDLRHRVTLQSLTETRDGANRVTGETWAAEASGIPAHIRPMTVNERMLAGQTASRSTHIIRIRYRSGVTAAMRLVDEESGTRVFEILGIRDLEERHREMLIDCIEVGAEVGAGSGSASGSASGSGSGSGSGSE